MGNRKEVVVNIPRLYKWESLDLIMFGYVQGLRYALPSLTVPIAITQFLKNFGLSEDQYPFEYAYQSYRRVIISLVEIEDGFVSDVENIIL